MVRNLVIVGGVVLLALVVAVATGLLEIPGLRTRSRVSTDAPPVTREQLGDDLYTAQAFPALDPEAGKFKGDPLTLRGHVQIKDKQEVPAQVAGQILYIGEGVPDGVIDVCG